MILQKFYIPFQNFISKGHSRSVKAKKNVIGSFLIKGANLAISFIMVPMVLGYLNPTKYGIWMTVSSIIHYFGFLDIGLGHGLRNRFAESKARDDNLVVKTYVSTTYALLLIIITVIYLCYLIANRFINWSVIFNTSEDLNTELNLLFFIVFSFFCIRFVVQIITTILIADQRPALSALIKLIAQSISAIIIFILTLTTSGSLIYISLAYSATPVLIMIIASFYFFIKDYKEYIPSVKFIQFGHSKKLMNLGIKFFIIQIAVIIMFSTDNLIVTQLYGPDQVTPYSIAYKYFNFIGMTFTIIVTPFWSAFTEAWVKKDYGWIKRIIQKLKRIWLLYLVLGIAMISLAKFIYALWVGKDIIIPFSLTLAMGLYFLARAYGGIYVNFLNGTGKVKLQFYTAFFSAILNIPLSIFLAKTLNFGLAGIILATFICISYGPFIAPIQYRKIMNGTAKGIWNK